MNGKIINGVLILAVAIFLTLLAIHVRIGITADSVALLKTDGISCGSCATRISLALQGVKGVAATQVDMPQGMVVVGYNSRAIQPEALADEVRKAGFESWLQKVMTPARFRETTGRDLGQLAVASKEYCSGCNDRP
jgi:copper chaperone CopZ